MSTSTDLLLLHQQVDSLVGYMDWIVAGITLTITVLLALFALIQFVYQRKLQKSDIDALEKNLADQIGVKLQEAEERLRQYSVSTVHEVEGELRREINFMDADIARRFAIDCRKDALPATAFSWWLRAAVGYAKSNSMDMYGISITNAKESLESVDSDFDRDSLFEASTRIVESFDFLEKTHKSETDLLRDMFKDKCKKKPKESSTAIQI